VSHPAGDLDALARRWVEQLPGAFLDQLAQALRAGPTELAGLRHEVALPASTEATRTAVRVARAGQGPYLAGLVAGRRQALAEVPTVVPVWTGPPSDVRGGRLTFAVVTDLVAEAEREIVLASYATRPGALVTQALLDAEQRGVDITLVLERAQDNAAFTGQAHALAR
jgi:phosphatidylserine/phosphatidylglycerophosphate/cardiolipin synthase-like enzyme